jgi:signal transduction histidine kinase
MANRSAPAATSNQLDVQLTDERPPIVSLDRLPNSENRRKDTFVATLAHELRQPLSTMLAAVEIVRGAHGAAATHRAAEVMARQLGQMSRLVDDLVDAMRWERGKMSLTQCRLDLRGVIWDAAADIEVAVAERGQELFVADEPEAIWVNGDRQRLVQVVSNLLRNAVNYTQPGGRIMMSVDRTASIIALRVSDTGRGIEAEMLPHVFDLFSQMRAQEGTGLGIGLSIVREIVLLHGGSVEARSAGTSQGSEFIVRLPAHPNGDARSV